MSQASFAPSPSSALPPPNAHAFPLIGSLPWILRRGPQHYFDTFVENYGDIASVKLGPSKVVLLASPELAQQVLVRDQGLYQKQGPFWDTIRRLTGRGLVSAEGEAWQWSRKLLAPYFSQKALRNIAMLVDNAIEKQVAGWPVGSQPVGASCDELTTHVLMSAVFGGELKPEEVKTLRQSLNAMFKTMIRTFAFHSAPPKISQWLNRDFDASLRAFRGVVLDFITRKRAQDLKGADFVSALLQAQRDGLDISDGHVVEEALAMFTAGFETTASTLSWSLLELSRRPELLRCLRQCIPKKEERVAWAFENIRQPGPVGHFLREILRLYPPVFWIPRSAQEDTILGGYAIKKGTTVAPLVYAIQRHPEYWSEAQKFMPERFENMSQDHHLAWMPFGAGPRKCIGSSLALLELHLALAHLIPRLETNVGPAMPGMRFSIVSAPKGKPLISLS